MAFDFSDNPSFLALKNAFQFFRRGVIGVDQGGSIIWINHTLLEQLQYQEDYHQPRNIFELIPYMNLLKWMKICKTIKNEKSYQTKMELITPGDKLITASIDGVYYEHSEKGSLILLMVEIITEDSQPQIINVKSSQDNNWLNEKINEEETFLLARFTLEQAKEMILWIDVDSNIIFANKSFYQLTGYSQEDVAKTSAFLLYSNTETAKEGRLKLWEQLRIENQTEQETELIMKNGTKFPVYRSLNYIKCREREFICIFMRDARERKKREEELEISQKEVKALSNRLKEENVLLKQEISTNHNFNNIIASSPKYRKILRKVAQVAETNANVLITGETGTGKELLARAIHSLSDREEAVMVKVNCAALPENLIESELFGHEKGAFTGASKQKRGRFELANKGTLFLDEIGELPLHLQVKLLRVLQEGEFERVGGTKTLKVDVRIIAATNRNLEQMIADGTFREDLFYRLNVFPIKNLPLRERKEDIPALVNYFVKRISNRLGKTIEEIKRSDIEFLQQYDFPGNVRELENLVERAVILSNGKKLELKASFSHNQLSK